jgi:hypothetical protein
MNVLARSVAELVLLPVVLESLALGVAADTG